MESISILEQVREINFDPEFAQEMSGCTAVSGLFVDNKLYIGNAGDSRAVLCSKGKAVELSFDHKPNNPTESQRIMKAGGFVEAGRVNGNLALSRALGDFEFKQNQSITAEEQAVTADPDVTIHEICEDDEFLVLACDGIWDCLSSQEVVGFLRKSLAEKVTLSKACEMLMDRCLAPDCDYAGIGCDNMTVVIVAILNGKSIDEWYDKVSSKLPESSDNLLLPTPKIDNSMGNPSEFELDALSDTASESKDKTASN